MSHHCTGDADTCGICSQRVDAYEARNLSDQPPPARLDRRRGVSLRKRFSGETERQQWREARYLLTGAWPA